MQKVSKQSLAMLALSILLAISIALTFTFAATTVSKKATGSITFTGSYAVTWAGGSVDGSGDMTFELDENCFDVTADGTKLNATLNATGKAALEAYTVKFTNATASGATYNVVAANADENGAKGTITVEMNAANATNKALAANTETEALKLSDLITSITVADATGAEIKFVVTATIQDAA